MTENQLSKQFTPSSILLYALPTVFTMVFMATYMIVDGMIVAMYVDEYAFSALNIAYPVISAVVALGLMLSMGSSAIIGKLMGEGKEEEARRFFTQVYVIGILLGLGISATVVFFVDEILVLLQCSDILFPYTRDYLVSYSYFYTLNILQIFAQTYLITSGKPILGFVACLLGGLGNIIFDYLFIAILGMGVEGASFGTAMGNAIPALFALGYFIFNRKNTLHFVKFHWDFKRIGESCVNGSSEFVTNIAMSITTLLFNIIMLEWAGEAGVASITTVLYIQMFQMGVYTGFSFGVAPLISYKYGAKEESQLKLLVKVGNITMLISSAVVVVLSYLYAEQAIALFIPPDSETFHMAKEGLLIYNLSYLFMGCNVFQSSLFTALSNGKISAILSCTRTLVLLVAFLLLLPKIFALDGVWMAVPLAELLSLFMAVYYLKKFQKHYGY